MTQHASALHQAVLEEPAAAIDEAGAVEVARTLFGLTATAKKLGGERDANFHLNCSNGRSYLLKVSHPGEDPGMLDFQTQAMQWIEQRDPTIPAQRVIPADDGRYSQRLTIAGRESVVRLLSYIDGVTWHDISTPSKALAASLGAMLARLNRALHDFKHPSQDYRSLWDLKSADEVAPLAKHIPDEDVRRLVEGHLSDYLATVPKLFGQLPWQVIHGDINPRNVIVSAGDPHMPAGIIDFGDMIHSPRIFDLAILCAYSLDADGCERAKAAATAYHRENSLTDAEKSVLLPSIKCRLAIMLCIAYWRSKLYPENIAYIQRSTQYATRAVRMIADHPPGELEAQFATIFHQEAST